MFKQSLRFSVPMAFLVAFSGSAYAQLCDLPDLAKGQDYNEARKVIIDAGFSPHTDNWESHCHPEQRDTDYMSTVQEFVCPDFPEVESCTGTGMGYCSMQFVSDKDNLLRVTTRGGSPDVGLVGPDGRGQVVVHYAEATCPLF